MIRCPLFVLVLLACQQSGCFGWKRAIRGNGYAKRRRKHAPIRLVDAEEESLRKMDKMMFGVETETVTNEKDGTRHSNKALTSANTQHAKSAVVLGIQKEIADIQAEIAAGDFSHAPQLPSLQTRLTSSTQTSSMKEPRQDSREDLSVAVSAPKEDNATKLERYATSRNKLRSAVWKGDAKLVSELASPALFNSYPVFAADVAKRMNNGDMLLALESLDVEIVKILLDRGLKLPCIEKGSSMGGIDYPFSGYAYSNQHQLVVRVLHSVFLVNAD